MSPEYLTLCVECVNGNHGFGDERVRKHSSEAAGTCEDCGQAKQVATYRITRPAPEPDTPESVAVKATAAREVFDLFRRIVR